LYDVLDESWSELALLLARVDIEITMPFKGFCRGGGWDTFWVFAIRSSSWEIDVGVGFSVRFRFDGEASPSILLGRFREFILAVFIKVFVPLVDFDQIPYSIIHPLDCDWLVPSKVGWGMRDQYYVTFC
jgi:hypothetical protein